MHAMLKPAMRRTWRDRDSVQFGVDPARAVVLSPVDDASYRFLKLLDGTRGPALLRDEATALGLDPGRADRLLETLARGGVLDDADSLASLAGALRHRSAAMERWRPDLASLSVLHPGPGAAAAVLAARRGLRVRVHGAGRVGAAVGVVLAAAGVGQVDVRDSGTVEPWDTAPAGISDAQTGDRRDAAARGAIRRAAPDPRPRTGGSPGGRGAEPRLALAVLAPRDGLHAYAPDPSAVRELMAAGVPHLYAGVLEGVGTVGPLVLPGVTGCAGCVEAARAEEDPAWPRMLAQLRSTRPAGPQACDVALATLVAGLAAAHALAFLDAGAAAPAEEGAADGVTVAGEPVVAGVDGAGAGTRTEFALNGLGMRVFPVVPHPACACGAARRTPRVTMAG